MKLHLRDFFWATLVLAILIAWKIDRPEPARPKLITTAADFDSAIADGKCILFVNCYWNPEVLFLGQEFNKFTAVINSDASLNVITVDLDSFNQNGEIWQRVEKLWKDNNITPGAYKNMNGAGRIVWFQDGTIVATEPELGQRVGDLLVSTAKAFP
jgi:hypothetical protein